MAFRFRGEIYRSGEKNVSTASDKGTACWAIDHETIVNLRCDTVRLLAVYVRDENEVYLTRLKYFDDHERTKGINYEGAGGADQRCLPLQNFVKMSSGDFDSKLAA